MTTPDYKALCAELIEAMDSETADWEDMEELKARARAALAAEVVGVSEAAKRLQHFVSEYKQMRGLDPEYVYGVHAGDATREASVRISDLESVLARWDSAPRPIPVSERLNDADLEQIARAFTDDPVQLAAFVCGARWAEHKLNPSPAHALPTPAQEGADG